MITLGRTAIYVGLLSSLMALFLLFLSGAKRDPHVEKKANISVLVSTAMTLLAALLFLYFLITGNYELVYVYSYTSSDLPLIYKISALWAGDASSLLFYLLLYTLTAALYILLPSKSDRFLKTYTSAFLMAIIFFYYWILAFVSNPFQLMAWSPTEGYGMNPMLQSFWMMIHPVTIFIGYIFLSVTFASAIASLFSKREDALWIQRSRRWTMTGWLFLTFGIITGGQWAYAELGWGGYWAWDPVENASLLPWLTSTAFLHGAIAQERRGLCKIFNKVLIITTFALILFGSFITRSGVLQSVHVFSDQVLGWYFMGFTLFLLLFSFSLLYRRKNLLQKEQKLMFSFLSKETLFFYTIILLVGIAFAVFMGTVFPLLTEWVMGFQLSVGLSFFNRVSAPLGALLLLFIGLCSLLTWKKTLFAKRKIHSILSLSASLLALCFLILYVRIREALPLLIMSIAVFALVAILADVYFSAKVRSQSAEKKFLPSLFNLFLNNRRRYGGFIIHIGLVFLLFGISGSVYDYEQSFSLKEGEVIEIKDYSLTFKSLMSHSDGPIHSHSAIFTLRRDGLDLGTIDSTQKHYPNFSYTKMGMHGNLQEDLLVILSDWRQDGSVFARVRINPLVAWIWIGSYLMYIGALFAIWPKKVKS